MSDFFGDWNALLVLLLAGFLPNEAWRMLGLWLGGGVDESSELLVWVRAVATAILAGVIAQILVAPPGALASVKELVAQVPGRPLVEQLAAERDQFLANLFGADGGEGLQAFLKSSLLNVPSRPATVNCTPAFAEDAPASCQTM